MIPTPVARYLAAKKSVDDRAMNPHVQIEMLLRLRDLGMELDVLEIGAGIGTNVTRFLGGWKGVFQEMSYTLVEQDADALDEARQALTKNPEERLGKGWTVREVHGDKEILLDYERSGTKRQTVRVVFEQRDLRALFAPQETRRFDLLIGVAMLDLLDLEADVPRLLQLLRPGGLFWFPITYDGATFFEPDGPDLDLDERLMAAYHRAMDERSPKAGARTGRRLLSALPRAGAELLAAGSSDWIVYPKQGEYPKDERYFLEYVLGQLDQLLRGRADVNTAELDRWLEVRRQQLAQGELIYIAHQLDLVGLKP